MEIVEITQWRSQETKTITITQDVGGSSYDLRVREFIPQEGDSLARTWKTNGVRKYYYCAPYAIVNMEQTGIELMRFVDKNIETSIQYYIDDTHKLFWPTYAMACRQSQFAEVND